MCVLATDSRLNIKICDKEISLMACNSRMIISTEHNLNKQGMPVELDPINFLLSIGLLTDVWALS